VKAKDRDVRRVIGEYLAHLQESASGTTWHKPGGEFDTLGSCP
jgi:hypothetical protein